MASVEKLPSGRYRGVYYLAERPGEKPRKRHTKTYAHRKPARDAAIEAEGRTISDPQHDPRTGRIAWSTWERTWTPTRSITPRTRARAESLIRVHVMPRWGAVELVEITHHDVQRWVNELVSEKGLTPGTARKAFFELSASLKGALRAGHVRANPCTGVVLPTMPAAPERFLSDGEVDRLFFHLDGRYRVLVELLVETGLRLGEASALHWQRVDLEARAIRVAEQWDPEAGAVVAYTKGKAARSVPMTDRLVELLKTWAHDCPPGPSCPLEHHGPPCRSSLVIPSARGGGALDAHNFHARQWKRAVRLSGIGHCRPHDLRHTWASRLVTAGVPLERLQLWGGWESYSVVLRYAHLMTDGADLYRDALASRTRAPALRVVSE